MARRYQLDAVLNERMRNLEIRGAEQAEAAPRAERRQIFGQSRRNSRRIAHAIRLV